MFNIFIVVWRESLEAFLIVGILLAALRKNNAWLQGRKYLFAGVGGGVALAVTLAIAIVYAESELQGAALDHFQTVLIFVAAALVAHMCLWMKTHSREIKSNAEKAVQNSQSNNSYWDVAFIAALAIGREGMETVLFLYSSSLEAIENGATAPLIGGAFLGFFSAIATGTLVSKGLQFIKYQHFFRISSTLLLLMAGGFVIQGTNRLIQGGLLPAIMNHTWDTSFILSDTSITGKLVSMLTGYTSSPPLMVVLAYALFWAIYYAMILRHKYLTTQK